jgi:hypothetical protein
MKKYYLFIALVFCLLVNASGQNINSNENAVLDKLIQSRLRIEKEKIISDSLAKVFNGTFFRVRFGSFSADGGEWCGNSIVVLLGGKLIEFESRTDSILPLLSLVKKEFSLKTQTDAKVVESALAKIYPPSEFSDEKPEIIHNGNNWYFIRGKFFDSKSGYIVSVDQNLRISNIAYSMEALKK